jgi:hypothetical protein
MLNSWSNLFRCVEIAKVGGFSVSVYFDENYETGFDDYNSIKNYCKNSLLEFTNFVSHGDLHIQISKPDKYYSDSYNKKSKHDDSLEDVCLRIQKAKEFPKPEMILNDTCELLLRTCTNKLNLSFSQIQKIKDVAQVIAQLSFSEKIEVHHIAESIQYRELQCCYNAENESINFGKMISVKLGYIDKTDVLNAVNYLNSLLTNK